MIEIKKLSVSYAKKEIIKNLSFNTSKHLSVVGANGSGKSTLAKALCGLIPFEGEIILNERALSHLDLRERARMITYIPASLENFDPYICVRDFVLMGRYIYKNAYASYSALDYEKVDEVLKRLEILNLSDFSLSALSSGQQQLCMIASALVQNSEIVIFDEPTANLDPAHSVEISKIIKSLQKDHQTILITHDLNFAQSIKGEILFLSEQGTHYYTKMDDFFTLENLKSCYKTDFYHSALGIEYD